MNALQSSCILAVFRPKKLKVSCTLLSFSFVSYPLKRCRKKGSIDKEIQRVIIKHIGDNTTRQSNLHKKNQVRNIFLSQRIYISPQKKQNLVKRKVVVNKNTKKIQRNFNLSAGDATVVLLLSHNVL